MEKTADAVVVPMDAGWSDIGSWSSLWDISKKDENGNASLGDVVLHNSKDCYVRADDMLVAAIGVDDLVIVSTKDALMVAHKDSVQDAKTIAHKLKQIRVVSGNCIVKYTALGVSMTPLIMVIDTK